MGFYKIIDRIQWYSQWKNHLSGIIIALNKKILKKTHINFPYCHTIANLWEKTEQDEKIMERNENSDDQSRIK